MKLPHIWGEFQLPHIRGSFGGNRWIGFPPKAPPTWGGGRFTGLRWSKPYEKNIYFVLWKYHVCAYKCTSFADKYMLHHDHQEYYCTRDVIFVFTFVNIVDSRGSKCFLLRPNRWPYVADSRYYSVISQRKSSTCLACPLDLYTRPVAR